MPEKNEEQTRVEWVAAKLRDIRRQRGLTLQQVANRIGHESHSRVSDYEIVRYIPNLETLFAVLDALAISPNDFFKDMPMLKEIGKPKRTPRGKGVRPVAQDKRKAAQLEAERAERKKAKVTTAKKR